MSLSIVATPIGHPEDITLRALKVLREATVVIGEEQRVVSTLLKMLEIEGKKIMLLNEHSTLGDIAELAEICEKEVVALVSDCGTPGFCDPGADLVSFCRRNDIDVRPTPGVSSLATALSVCGVRLDHFIFRGFISSEKEARKQSIEEISRCSDSQVLMDTPYRLKKLLAELGQACPKRQAFLAMDMTKDTEKYESASVEKLEQKYGDTKAEFLLILFSEDSPLHKNTSEFHRKTAGPQRKKSSQPKSRRPRNSRPQKLGKKSNTGGKGKKKLFSKLKSK